MIDILDRIDELVDAQLRQEPSGYDHNINQPICRCGEDWHGLPITEAMQEMRQWGEVDDNYSYATDTSAVICPGSNVEGPLLDFAPARRHIPWPHLRESVAPRVDRLVSNHAEWWRCDSPQLLEFSMNRDQDYIEGGYGSPDVVRMRAVARINEGPAFELYADPLNDYTHLRYEVDADDFPVWLELHCVGRPPAGDWHRVQIGTALTPIPHSR